MVLFASFEDIKQHPRKTKEQLERGKGLAVRIGGLTLDSLEYDHSYARRNSALLIREDVVGFKFFGPSELEYVDYEPTGCVVIDKETGELQVSVTPLSTLHRPGMDYDVDRTLEMMQNTTELYEGVQAHGPLVAGDLCSREGLLERVRTKRVVSVERIAEYRDTVGAGLAEDYVFHLPTVITALREDLIPPEIKSTTD